MKKFIAGMAVGHILTNALYLYLDGGFDRAKIIFDYLKEHPGEAPSFSTLVEYLMVGDKDDLQGDEARVSPRDYTLEGGDGEALKHWFNQIQRVLSMDAEGYSPEDIAEAVGSSPERIVSVLQVFAEETP